MVKLGIVESESDVVPFCMPDGPPGKFGIETLELVLLPVLPTLWLLGTPCGRLLCDPDGPPGKLGIADVGLDVVTPCVPDGLPEKLDIGEAKPVVVAS